MNELEFRSAAVVDVSYPKRTVTVVVAPYETPTEIHTARRSWTEIITRGAYAGVERRSNIRANRDHDWGKLAGKVVGAYPDRDEGLVCDVKMFQHGAGPETLELCAEDGLSASAGFGLMRENGRFGAVKPDAEKWEQNGSVRRLNHLFLDHVAFVPDPAYETATVVDVRNQPGTSETPDDGFGTPNRDRLQMEIWRSQAALLNSRYGV